MSSNIICRSTFLTPKKVSSPAAQLRLESLENRLMLHGEGDPEHELGDHIHAELSIFINGEKFDVPSGIGFNASGQPVTNTHTESADGTLHQHPVALAGTPDHFNTVGELFANWRNSTEAPAVNPDAFFSETQIFNNFADSENLVQFFVNGEANDEFENYAWHANDQMVITFGSTTPLILPIANETLLVGSPLHLAVNGFDDVGPLTFQVSSDNPDVEAVVVEGNRSMRIEVAEFGDMVFQLFEGRAPRPTGQIIELAESDFFDGIIFHRIIDGFVIQGGDPTGTGTGGSDLGDFDDQFHVDLQHNREGLLSYAKSNDDTNDSQFFITDGATRSLDFNHSIFGILTGGDRVRDEINNTPTGAGDRPLEDVVMEKVTIFQDDRNGVIMLKAADGATGTANITVTATDQDGNSFLQTFEVTLADDTSDGGAFFDDFDDVFTTLVDTPVTFQLTGQDVEGEALFFDHQPTDSFPITVDMNDETGATTVTPDAGFVGTVQFAVGVRDKDGSDTGQGFDFDIQQVTINVRPPSNMNVDLLSTSDSGSSSTDNITQNNTPTFNITGAMDGAFVELLRNGTVIGSGTASGDSVQITVTAASALADGMHSISVQQTVNSSTSDVSMPLAITIDTTPPLAFTSTPPTSATANIELVYDVGHPDEGTAGFTYSLEDAPQGATIHPGSGIVTWTPGASDDGLNVFRIIGTDLAGNIISQTVEVDVLGIIPTISIGDESIEEGDTGSKTLIFTVTLSEASSHETTVDFNLVADTATADVDYTSSSGTLSFAAGETEETISVDILGDLLQENDETFRVQLSNPTNATLEVSLATGTIVNNDLGPRLAIFGSEIAEGDSGETVLRFTVNLVGAENETTTVDFATSEGTATASADYDAISGTLTFNVGETQKFIDVPILGDVMDEMDEVLFVTLTNSSGALIAIDQATGTILDDDAAPSISIDDQTTIEGDSGTTSLVFTVTLSEASGREVEVFFQTDSGSATAGDDFIFADGLVTFAAGETQKSISIEVIGETLHELDETFSVTLFDPAGATIDKAIGAATIENDDAVPTLTIEDVEMLEGDDGFTSFQFLVRLSGPTSQLVSFSADLIDGTATASQDNLHMEQQQSLGIFPGETETIVTVFVIGDNLFESDEEFSVQLTSVTGATVERDMAIGRILNDDPEPVISISDVSADEGNSDTTFTFDVTLSGPSDRTITVDYQMESLSATGGDDFMELSGTITFEPEQVHATIEVEIVGDTEDEPDETFAINLSNPQNTTIADGQGLGEIVNDDALIFFLNDNPGPQNTSPDPVTPFVRANSNTDDDVISRAANGDSEEPVSDGSSRDRALARIQGAGRFPVKDDEEEDDKNKSDEEEKDQQTDPFEDEESSSTSERTDSETSSDEKSLETPTDSAIGELQFSPTEVVFLQLTSSWSLPEWSGLLDSEQAAIKTARQERLKNNGSIPVRTIATPTTAARYSIELPQQWQSKSAEPDHTEPDHTEPDHTGQQPDKNSPQAIADTVMAAAVFMPLLVTQVKQRKEKSAKRRKRSLRISA